MTLRAQPKQVEDTVKGFGWEWCTFNKQIQDTYMTSKDNFLDFIYPMTENCFKGKIVLDAGCGMGRFLKLAAEFGSRDVIGVDLSRSVEVAYCNTRTLPNAHVVQADILLLPLDKKFDYIFSLGVLHHMQEPKEGFSRLVKLLRPDGEISVWVYGREGNSWVVHLVSPLRTYFTSRLPKPILYLLSMFLGLILYSSLKLVYKPANEILKRGHLLPYNDYLYYNSRLTYASLVSIVFDQLVPQLAAYISKAELERWFSDEKLTKVIVTSRNNMSWRGLGTRTDDQY